MPEIPEHARLWMQEINGVNVGDIYDNALLVHCAHGPKFSRDISDNLRRAYYAALKDEKEYCAYYHGIAVKFFLSY